MSSGIVAKNGCGGQPFVISQSISGLGLLYSYLGDQLCCSYYFSVKGNIVCFYSYKNQISNIGNSLKLSLILLGIWVQILSWMKVFVKFFIIISPNRTKYMYVDLVHKENVTHQTQLYDNILYKCPIFCEDLAYMIKYY